MSYPETNISKNKTTNSSHEKKTAILIAVLVVLLTGLLLIMRNAGTWLVKNDPPEHADAMVLLMGSIPDRVLQAADVYRQGFAPKLIIVQESMDSYRKLEERGVHFENTTQQCFKTAVQLGIPASDIVILPGDARSTQQEARIVREYIHLHPEITSITLVTSPDHTRRASMIFEKAFSKQNMPVTVHCSPSKYSSYTGIGWWKSKEGIQTVLMEYLKIGNFLFLEGRKL